MPDTTFHFLIIHLLQTQAHPGLHSTSVQVSPSRSHVHWCSLDTFSFFTSPTEQHIPPLRNVAGSKWSVSCSVWIPLLFCTELLTPLYPKQTHSISTLLYLHLQLSLLFLPAPVPASSKPHWLLLLCTTSNTIYSINHIFHTYIPLSQAINC